MNQKRVRILREGSKSGGPVVYWMSRDQRVCDNWAILYARDVAVRNQSSLIVLFCLPPSFLDASIRQYGFMIQGLRQVQLKLEKKNIPFVLLPGAPEKIIPQYIRENNIGFLVTDFSPLRITREWKEKVVNKIRIPFHEVDAHNIVPSWIASSKQEFGAYTIRSKINKLLPEFLESFPLLKKQKHHPHLPVHCTDWEKAISTLKADHSLKEIDTIKSGEDKAQRTLETFIENKLARYNETRNDPTKDGQSNLSPYVHFGQISAQRIAFEIHSSQIEEAKKMAFLEELIIRRELSDNFCFYNQRYDSFEGFPVWAQKTLNDHRKDKREFTYSSDDFENAQTHDRLWNAAQGEMMHTGKMHGYMRMYWAKKILEWSRSPEEAQAIAIYLNDRYELDGRDPNGYAGIAWSIGGVHDRAWQERRIYGKIRYMNENGCRRKFDVDRYIKTNLFYA